MPGNIQPSEPTEVLPYGLCLAFSEELRLEAIVNTYPDGSSERAPRVINPRRFYRNTRALTNSQWLELQNFYFEHVGVAFYFYHLRETVPPWTYDPTGVDEFGRYIVVFDGGWTEEIRMGRAQVSFALREVL